MIEELAVRPSVVQRLDPRVKIVLVLLFSVLTAVCDRFVVLLSALAMGAMVVVVARVPIKELVKRLTPVNTLIVFLWLFLPFTYLGEPLFSIFSLPASREGVLYAARITIKSNAIMLMLISLVATCPIFTLGHAMHDLGIPKKLVHLFFFTYRYIHVLHREFVRLSNAMKVRGFVPGTNLHTYKTYAYMVGMLLVRSCDRAQRVYDAMLCRGFKGKLYSLSAFSIRRADIVSLVLMFCIILLLGVLEWSKIV